MNKLQQLKKRLQIEAAITGGGAVLLVAVYLLLTHFIFTADSDRSQKRALVNQLNQEVQTKDASLRKAQTSLQVFSTVSGADFAAKVLDRQAASSILRELREKYHLASLSIRFSKISEPLNDELRKPSIKVNYSYVELSFSGLTDELILSFIDETRQRLKGMVRIRELRLSREKEISNDIVVAIQKGEIPEMVRGSMKFHWLAFQEVKADAAKTPPLAPGR